ncbi:hypothetical protein [Streptomyces flaveolus]|uniref:hypothetical protein n=1 Tax=Streptomyces flaveolus TaxID=67297 RepID=UPI0036F6FFCD
MFMMLPTRALVAGEGDPQVSIGTAPSAPGEKRRHDLVLTIPQTSEIRTFQFSHHLVDRITAQRGIPVRSDAGQTGKPVPAAPLNGPPQLMGCRRSAAPASLLVAGAQAFALSGTQCPLSPPARWATRTPILREPKAMAYPGKTRGASDEPERRVR